MTPIKLINALQSDIEDICRKSAVFGGKIQVFKGDIPLSQDDEDEDDKYFPCVVIRPSKGSIKGADEEQDVRCELYICAYDDNTDMQGYTDTMLLCERIIQEISARGNVGKQFRLQYPIEWDTEESEYPYFICRVSMSFKTYIIGKSDYYKFT